MMTDLDLTKSQEKGIEQICELFPGDEGRVLGVVEDGSVEFEIRDAVYRVNRRGKFEELRAEAAVVPPAPVGDGAALPSVEDPSPRISGDDEGVGAGDSPDGGETVRAPDRRDGGAAGGLPEISDEGVGSGNDPSGIDETPVESPDRQDGPEAEGGSVSGPESSAQAEAEQVDPGAALLPPHGPGAPVPMVDSLPEEARPAVFEAMSLADERQVVADLEGNALTSYVYGFRVGGQMVYGLSWIGARESVRTFNTRTEAEIRIDKTVPPRFEDVTVKAQVGWDSDANAPIMEEVPGIRVSVYGEDGKYGGGQWGTATVPRDQINKKKTGPDGRYAINPDGFAANKALSKAQRNALEPQIPRWFVEQLIALYKGQGNVEYIEGTGDPVHRELPPALTDDRAKAAGDKARELYGELKRLVGTKVITPARFHQLYTAVQHDHERLDEFVAYMEEQVAKAKESSS